MKNLILVFAILFTVCANAQLKMGLKAGLNISTLSGDDVEIRRQSPESKTGFTVGAFFLHQFSDMFAIQPEIYFTSKGATYQIPDDEVTIDMIFNYIEIPVLLKLIIPIENSPVHPTIFTGPFIAINSTAKAEEEIAGRSSDRDLDDIKSTEFGLQFGGGIGFIIENNELGFDVRYILGLTNIDDSENEDDGKNSVISFNVYFGFSLL